MHNDRPSAKHMVLTLVGWGVGLLAVAGLMVAISTALAPKTPSDKAPVPAEATATTTPSVAPTLVVPPPVPTSTPTTATVPSVTPISHSVRVRSLEGKVVAIDAGHQAHGDPTLEPVGPGATEKKARVSTGATGVQTHNTESAINLRVALKLRAELVRRGAQVVMVRTKQDVNISNSKRAGIANRAGADLFIRIHCDSSDDPGKTGLSTLVPRSNRWTSPILRRSKDAGVYIHDAVVARTAANNLGVVSRGDLSGFNWSKVPTVLVETGFLSNPAEDVKLGTASYQQALATGLASGIERYLLASPAPPSH